MKRFSSRRQPLDSSFLNRRLQTAISYDRIAGYFSSSILEIAGESLETITESIRMICNSDLDPRDVETARAANQAMRREWCESEPEKRTHEGSQTRFRRLYTFLKFGKLQVKVLPSESFGLIHGKAGVITLTDGTKTAFLGSTNETYAAWKLNYELLWEDDSADAVAWVQEEFDALWSSPQAVALAEFVVEDIGRLANRTIVPNVQAWREAPYPEETIIETPVYRREFGLWEHQKYFVHLAFEAHRGPHGARFILADMVGLGKTLQLALAVMLMALYGDRPVLVLAPKVLVWQWQDEMRDLLDMPSAVWTSAGWIDENGIEHPGAGPEGIKKCPRRVGIVSQGLITSNSEVVDLLKSMTYECIIVDEAHHARRKNLGEGRENEKTDPTNLLKFVSEVSSRTRSLLLATATPVQMYPVEIWDLLDALAQGSDNVLGNRWSKWRRASEALDMVLRRRPLPEDEYEAWDWLRNPLPTRRDHYTFGIIRRSLDLEDDVAVAQGDSFDKLSAPDRKRLRDLRDTFIDAYNPFLRHVVRRTREYLENEIDPETHEPYLKPVKVVLSGDSEAEALSLPPYLADAYERAKDFCHTLARRLRGSGMLKTLLLRRVGSTIDAGMKTAEKLLSDWGEAAQDEKEEEDDEAIGEANERRALTPEERLKLTEFLDALEANKERDPKFAAVRDLLLSEGWLEQGCIVFSQYFDSICWLAEQLSADLPNEKIGIYAGSQKSGLMEDGVFTRTSRDEIKSMVRRREIRLLLGTDAASEGLNLQTLGTLINLDLPWNPTRLEQRKGRIQRIGQVRDTVFVHNLRYRGSVEDRVHALLSDRLQAIHRVFGQIPDVLEDVWINIALGEREKAERIIGQLPEQHPFELKYHRVHKVPWENCSRVLEARSRKEQLLKGW